MSTKQSEPTAQRGVQSIEVGFKVIRAMEAAERALPLRDIAVAAGMSPSQVHIYLVSFIREGMAYQDPATGRYGLGRFAIQLGLSAIRQLDVVGLAQDELSRIQEASGFATYLSLWGNRGPSIVSKVDGQNQGSLSVRLGYVLPVITSATGQVFAAHLEDELTRDLREEEIANFKKSTDSGEAPAGDVPPPADIEKLKKSVRASGYAMTTNSINSNFGAVAAPVLDFNGRIVAAVTILAPTRMIAGVRKKETITLLLQSTKRLSERLGHGERTKDTPK